MLNAKELIRKVRRIQIRTSRITSEALSGNYHSAFRGRGIEFEKVRPYIVGDDIRAIDWNVSARVGSPHIKIFREERELSVMLAVDLSASQDFGTRGSLKRELVAEIAATIAFSAIRNGDKVGLLAFTDRVERIVPPRKGTRHVLRIVRELLGLEVRGKGTRIAAALDEALRIARQRSVLFIISDFQDTGWERSMAIARRRHDCIPVVVGDRGEESLPRVGLIELEDPETGERLTVDTSDRGVRARFASLAADDRLRLQQSFRRLKIDAVEVETGGDFVRPLTEMFRRRESRRAR
jgi:uncharacterized protein (DUF58 family)